MNKLTILLCSLIGASSISGCSSIDYFEGRSFWGSGSDAETISSTKDSKQSSIADKTTDNKKDVIVSLSEHQIESFPEWFDLNSLDRGHNSFWQKINFNISKSFSANLSDHGVPTRWIDGLRVSDYIDLSTNHDGQAIWVEQSENGSFVSLYTFVSSNKSYYLEITESGPVITRGLSLPTRSGSVQLTPQSKIEDLSDLQKTAVFMFVSDILNGIEHDQEVIVSKGKTKINFEYTYISPSKLGNIRLLPSVSQYQDYIMTYKPD